MEAFYFTLGILSAFEILAGVILYLVWKKVQIMDSTREALEDYIDDIEGDLEDKLHDAESHLEATISNTEKELLFELSEVSKIFNSKLTDVRSELFELRKELGDR
jgi:hypothetical protein